MPIDPRQESDAKPHGSAGLVNQAAHSTVADVAPAYSAIADAARHAAHSKRETDHHAMHGRSVPSEY